jgi:hypothetical protein
MKMDSSMNMETKTKNHHMETLLATCYIHCGAHNSMLQRAACDQPGYMPTYLVAMKKNQKIGFGIEPWFSILFSKNYLQKNKKILITLGSLMFLN